MMRHLLGALAGIMLVLAIATILGEEGLKPQWSIVINSLLGPLVGVWIGGWIRMATRGEREMTGVEESVTDGAPGR